MSFQISIRGVSRMIWNATLRKRLKVPFRVLQSTCESCSWIRGLHASPWCLIQNKTSHNYGSIKSILPNTRLNYEWCLDIQKIQRWRQVSSRVCFRGLRRLTLVDSVLKSINPFPNDKFLESSKLKEFADDNFNFDEDDWKFSKRIENTVGKGEIARNEQFLLFPQCFQKACTADT